MATITTKAGLVEDALVAQLQARAGLTGVHVDVGPLGDDSARGEWIQFGVGEAAALSGTQTWGSLGNYKKNEACSVQGRIFVARTDSGARTIRESRDRALELMAEVEDQLRYEVARENPNKLLGGLVTQIALEDWQHRRFADASVIDFTVQYEAELRRT